MLAALAPGLEGGGDLPGRPLHLADHCQPARPLPALFRRPRGVGEYLADASYWCYLAGFPIQAALQVWFAPRTLPMVVEFVLVNALTFTLLLVSYELCVRHSWIGLLLNGKRPERQPKAEVIVIVARGTLPEPEHVPEPVRDRPRERVELPPQRGQRADAVNGSRCRCATASSRTPLRSASGSKSHTITFNVPIFLPRRPPPAVQSARLG